MSEVPFDTKRLVLSPGDVLLAPITQAMANNPNMFVPAQYKVASPPDDRDWSFLGLQTIEAYGVTEVMAAWQLKGERHQLNS